jgi:hypothetical protein
MSQEIIREKSCDDIHSNFDFRQNGRNSFKNVRIRAVQIRPPFLVKFPSIWSKFDPWLVCLRQFGLNSTGLETFRPILAQVRAKMVIESKLRVFDHF